MEFERNETFSPCNTILRRQRSDLSILSTTSGSSYGECQPKSLGSCKLDDKTLKQTLEKELKAKSAISVLQEFVQCSKDFRLPPRQPILQWSYETRMKDHASLEFQARAIFLIGGTLHHSVGTWHLSKKLAQRDAAERAVEFFIGHWCDVLLADEDLANGVQDPGHASFLLHKERGASGFGVPEVQMLELFSRRFRGNDDTNRWHETYEDKQWQAFVEMEISGVPHKFAGPKCFEHSEAYRQAAKRVLWYLQHPDYVDAFEPDVDAIPVAMSAEPPCWTRNQSADESQQAVQRKTAIMRLQNRLQQHLGHQLKPGQSVWEWSYETDGKCWPPFVRASVRLAVFNKEFVGDWVRTHRAAQLDTCVQVEDFLNSCP